MVKKVCRKLKWKYGTEFKFTSSHIVRHNALTGEVLHTHEFEEMDMYNKSTNWTFSKDNEMDVVDDMETDSGKYLRS